MRDDQYVRQTKVDKARRKIASGTLETPEAIDKAVEGLLRDVLRGPKEERDEQ